MKKELNAERQDYKQFTCNIVIKNMIFNKK